MTKIKKKHSMNVQMQADKSVIPAGKAGKRILEITLKAPSAAREKPRIPLNLALVIDRSGSMHGEKLHFVKQAAAHVIDLLNEEDHAAIVIYDNEVETLLPSQLMTDSAKRQAKSKIRGIQSGGSTYLYAGWLAGCREAAEAINQKLFSRTLLLTDGLANVGVRDVGTISMHAQELFTRNVSTSCFGVGSDYDEHMLESIANHGGGNFHFLETVNAIPLVFEREFDEIISVSLKQVRVVLTLPTKAEAKVSANWRAEREGSQYTIYLGSLVADQAQAVYLQLSNLDSQGESQVDIPVKVIGVDVDQVEHEVETTLTLTAVPDAEETTATQDAELMERFGMVDLADQANEALKLERSGDRRGSSVLMQKALSLHQPNISDKTYDKYDRMSTEMSQGYNALDRKRRHYDSYQSKRGWQSIRDYRLSFSTGLPIAEVEDKFVLINTASATSIATVPEWMFMGEVIQFEDKSHRLTCEQLTKALGTRVDVMLGMDVLSTLYVRTNPTQGVIQFSRLPFQSSGVHLHVDLKNVPPRSFLKIGEKNLPVCLVTALKLNYIPEEMAAGLHQIGDTTDSLPGGIDFSLPLYKVPISLGHHLLTLNCGVTPDALQASLDLKTGEGVLGADLLQSVPLTLAFPEGEMILYV